MEPPALTPSAPPSEGGKKRVGALSPPAAEEQGVKVVKAKVEKGEKEVPKAAGIELYLI